jgi:hypothetical protein
MQPPPQQPRQPQTPNLRTVRLLVMYGVASIVATLVFWIINAWLASTTTQDCVTSFLVERCTSHTANDALYGLSAVFGIGSFILAVIFFVVALFVFAFRK